MIYNKPKDFDFRVANNSQNEKKRKQKQPKIKKIKTEYSEYKTVKIKPKKSEIIKVASFFIVLYFGTIVAFILPLRPTYSETEKRALKEFPQFNILSVIGGTYFDDISTWFSDTFPFRESMTKFNTFFKSLSGFSSVKIHGDVEGGDDIPDIPLDDVDADVTVPPTTTEPVTEFTTAPETTVPEFKDEPITNVTEPKPDVNVQSLGAILIAGNSAYEYYSFSNTLAPRFINCINSIKMYSGNKSNVYTLIPPTSIDIDLNDAIRKDINSSNQQKALEYFNASFKNTTVVNTIFENLRNHRTEYLYFRTDHHWTALGAYYTYEQFALTKGITPVKLENYEEVRYDGFLGSFYSSSGQSPALGRTPDTVIAYKPINNVDFTITQTDGQTLKWNVINDVSDYAPSYKYGTFIAGDQPYSKILNNDLNEGDTCLVIKDSFANAFIPFLIPHYKTIHIIDPRYFKSTLSEFTQDNKIDDIIFISNISTTRNEIFIKAMEKFIK